MSKFFMVLFNMSSIPQYEALRYQLILNRLYNLLRIWVMQKYFGVLS